MYHVYILRSEKDGKRYIGQTGNLEQRLSRHNEGRVPSTKYRRPLHLIHSEEYETRADALARERYLKSPDGYYELEVITGD